MNYEKFHTDNWLFYVIMTLLMTLVGISFGKIFVGLPVSVILHLISGFYPSLTEEVIEVIVDNCSFVFIFILLMIICKIFYKKNLRELFLKKEKERFKWLLMGIFGGFILSFLCIIIAILFGKISVSYQGVDVLILLLTFISCCIQSSIEELLFRGFLLEGMKKRYSTSFSIIISGLLFSILHILNPAITLLAIIDISIVGIVFAYLKEKYDSLNLVIGMHLMWNFTEEIIFGSPNSGIIFQKPIFMITASTNSIFYNQQFGIESTIQTFGLYMIIFIVISLVIPHLQKNRIIR